MDDAYYIKQINTLQLLIISTAQMLSMFYDWKSIRKTEKHWSLVAKNQLHFSKNIFLVKCIMP